MNKLVITSIFLLCAFSIFAQVPLDSAYLQITYLEDFVRNIDHPEKKRYDEMVLNIGKFSSEFYSKREDKVKYMMDSLLRSGRNVYDAREVIGEYPRSYQYYHVYKNMPSIGKLTGTDQILFDSYQYEEELVKPVWEFLSDRKEIQGYACQKAMTRFRGRKWLAWYTTEIPISDGPWKLCGLPGLIFDAMDSDSLYHFYCVGVKQLKDQLPIFINGKYIKCTKQEFYKMNKELKGDLAAYMKRQPGVINAVVTDPNGKTVKPKKYLDMEVEDEPVKK